MQVTGAHRMFAAGVQELLTDQRCQWALVPGTGTSHLAEHLPPQPATGFDHLMKSPFSLNKRAYCSSGSFFGSQQWFYLNLIKVTAQSLGSSLDK